MYMGHSHLHWGARSSRASRCGVAHDDDVGHNVRVRVGVRVRARVEAAGGGECISPAPHVTLVSPTKTVAFIRVMGHTLVRARVVAGVGRELLDFEQFLAAA